jgi:hypothetical protein
MLFGIKEVREGQNKQGVKQFGGGDSNVRGKVTQSLKTCVKYIT